MRGSSASGTFPDLNPPRPPSRRPAHTCRSHFPTAGLRGLLSDTELSRRSFIQVAGDGGRRESGPTEENDREVRRPLQAAVVAASDSASTPSSDSVSAMNAGRSSGTREVTNGSSTTTSSSWKVAPAFSTSTSRVS